MMRSYGLMAAVLLTAAVGHAQTITSVVGHHAGDGYPAEVARVTPMGLACDGVALYASDSASRRVRVFPWAGVAATLNFTNAPELVGGLAISPTRGLLATDGYTGRVWGDLAGTPRVVAGSGILGFAGDGGPALAALLQGPGDVAAGPDGAFYIADTSNGRVRRVSPDGIITTLAGGASSSCGIVCDNGVPAASARFAIPMGVAIDDVTGDVYVSSYLGHAVSAIRRATGTVHRVAGTGVAGTAGDGGPATQAQLTQPTGLALGQDGTIYIADTGTHAVRAVGPDGVIRRIAGGGRRGAGADGPATSSALADPRDVALCGNALYIADTGNSRIRRVDLPVVATPTPPPSPTAPVPPTQTATWTQTAMATATATPTRTSTTIPTRTYTATPTCACCAQCA